MSGRALAARRDSFRSLLVVSMLVAGSLIASAPLSPVALGAQQSHIDSHAIVTPSSRLPRNCGPTFCKDVGSTSVTLTGVKAGDVILVAGLCADCGQSNGGSSLPKMNDSFGDYWAPCTGAYPPTCGYAEVGAGGQGGVNRPGLAGAFAYYATAVSSGRVTVTFWATAELLDAYALSNASPYSVFPDERGYFIGDSVQPLVSTQRASFVVVLAETWNYSAEGCAPDHGNTAVFTVASYCAMGSPSSPMNTMWGMYGTANYSGSFNALIDPVNGTFGNGYKWSTPFACDFSFECVAASVEVSIQLDAVVTVTCAPSPVVVGARTVCTADVAGSVMPTGRVTWSENGQGRLSPRACILSSGNCSVAFTPSSADDVEVTASYVGDKYNGPSLGSLLLGVETKASSVRVACAPRSIGIWSPGSITCTAFVKGYKPTGSVGWFPLSVGAAADVPGYAIVYAQAVNRLFMTNDMPIGKVWVLDASAGTLVGSIKVGSYPEGLAFNPANGEVYVANEGSNTVSVINATSDSLIATIPVGLYPQGAAYAASNGDVYVTCTGSDQVYVIGPANTVAATVGIAPDPIGIAYAQSNHVMYVADHGDETVSAIDTSTNSVLPPIYVGGVPNQLGYVQATDQVYVAIPGGGSVVVINASTDTVAGTIAVGGSPTSVAEAPPARIVYVSDYPDSTVWAVDSATGTVVGAVQVVGFPRGMAFVPSDGKAFVAEYGSNVTVLANDAALSSNTCALKSARCSVTLKGAVSGSLLVEVTYPGDPNNNGSSVNATVGVRPSRTRLSIVCADPSDRVGSNTTCTAQLYGHFGPVAGQNITWTQVSGLGGVQFSPFACTMSGSGVCSVNVTGTGVGRAVIGASYQGDANNTASSKTRRFSVTKAMVQVQLSCTPSSFPAGGETNCTASVLGYYPTGVVTWGTLTGPGKVFFQSLSCPLSGGACSVTLSGTRAGAVTIRAWYRGDYDNRAGWTTITLIVV